MTRCGNINSWQGILRLRSPLTFAFWETASRPPSTAALALSKAPAACSWAAFAAPATA